MHLTQPHDSNSTAAVALLGIPYDANSSYLRGAADAPPRIREALFGDASNRWTEDGQDLEQPGIFHEAGDLHLPLAVEPAFAAIEQAVRAIVDTGQPLICLGGDHSITYPVLRGYQARYPDLTLLHFDAHPDLYHELGGRYSHACPFARIMEERLARRLVQVGIRTLNGHQFEQAQRFGVEIFTMRNLARLSELRLEGPLYISFDLDALDPAFAPGVSHFEPGGLSVREVLTILQGLRVPVVGADLVEYNPIRDHHTQTAAVCGKLVKEFTAAILRRGRPPREGWV
jgi:arginase